MSDISINEVSSDNNSDSQHDLALAVLEGLSHRNKSLPSKLFYDDKGSKLFTQIMDLEEYYPTRTEASILANSSQEMISHLDTKDLNLVELGCGDGKKTIIVLKELLKQQFNVNYVPLDISKAAIEFLVGNLKKEFKTIDFNVQVLVGDYFKGLNWLATNAQSRNMVLFLGSNIGNFNRTSALRFLRNLWYSLNDQDYVLIGFDLKKNLDSLYYAYNDSKGVTKEFNFNVLDRINTLLGGNFDRNNFEHQGLYNVQNGAMESYLFSLKKQSVEIKELGKTFHFNPWESIHMEYSYKYLDTDIETLAKDTGFKIVKHFTDSSNLFIDSMWQVVK